jgi:hypothetical protein
VAKAQQVFFELLAIHRGSGNLASTGNALSELVSLLRQDGKFRKSAEFTAELVAVYEELELSYGIAIGKFHAALSAFLRGNFEEVENLIRQAVEMLTEASFYHGEFELGLLANLQGQHDQAWLILKRYRGLSRTARSEFYLEWGLSVTAACQERYELAAEHLLTTSRLALEFRGGGFLGLTFPVAALVLAKLGRFKRAAELLALGREHLPGATGWLDKWELFAELPAALVDALGQDAYAAASARGRGLDLWQTAEELLSELSLDRPQPSWPNPEP